MSDIFEWYFTNDDENWQWVPDAADRWDAIEAGLDYCNSTPFKICRASKHDFPYDSLFDIDEIDCRATENDFDLWGEDQDSIFDKDPTKEQKKELESMLVDTFKSWVEKNKIQLEMPLYFDRMIDIEEIDGDYFCWVWTRYRGRPLLGVWGND